MVIDWFTVIAQGINFLILVWLLKRYLYKPILLAIDTREKHIAGRLTDASNQKKEAHQEREEFEKKNSEFEAARASLMTKAVADANATKDRMVDEAAKAEAASSAARQQALLAEMKARSTEVSRRAQEEVFAIAGKTLKDLAGSSLEQSVVQVFVNRIHALSGKDLDAFKETLKADDGAATVRSAFDLAAEQRKAIEGALNEVGGTANIKYETEPALVSGIEVVGGGSKLAWNIADYLGAFEKAVADLLTAPDSTQANPTQGGLANGSSTQGGTKEQAPTQGAH